MVCAEKPAAVLLSPLKGDESRNVRVKTRRKGLKICTQSGINSGQYDTDVLEQGGRFHHGVD